MRVNTLTKKIGAIALSIAMMLAFTVGMISSEKAYADQQGKAKLVKSIDVDTGVFLPEMNFTFEANPGDAAEATDQLQAVYAGVPDAVTIAPVNIPESTEINTEDTIEIESAITVDSSKFNKPGIYRYVVTEVTGNVEGMRYDDTELTLDVYVVNKESGGFEVVGYVIVDKETQEKLGDGNAKFNNTYKHEEGENDGLKNMVVTKNVTGNLGDKNKPFSFTVNVENAGDGDVFTLVKPDGTTEAFKQGQTVTMNLKHNESFTIKGLSKTDAIKVEEANYKADGYTTSIEATDNATWNENNATVTGNKDGSVTVTNNKNTDTPTGIFFHYAPYIALIAVAVGLLLMFRRRKEDK